ncbi:diguanylate cyclase [Dethiosulfovibrio sp. F2B]|uniref:GGDEF domain-containing response regulator n=1 Tax=Dethiosulfovibrio faecalis TaxID=2720018 RepID=UPI001F260B70|nr:diguanylate cyclase [Dethiosulfovibrio faecalis]MCF4151480.1 diguanylate cyclase [Dethiosulfovibrio faecalis]
MRILVAEDDMTTRVMLESLLKKWGYDPVVVSDGEEAWRVLSGEEAPHLAVIDWLMPGLEGTEICRLVRERNRMNGKYQYIVLLTVQSEKEDVVRGLEAGADDYVVKPFDSQELRMRLSVARRILELQDKLAFFANHDQLTKLLNRHALFERLSGEMARSDREGTPLTLGLLDLDHFKRINDTYGHLAGDRVLRSIAKILCRELRPYDVIGRYGGEEFVMVLPGASSEEGYRILDRIRERIGDRPLKLDDDRVELTVSMGLAEYRQGMTMDGLIARADEAMYRAKDAGRDKVSL